MGSGRIRCQGGSPSASGGVACPTTEPRRCGARTENTVGVDLRQRRNAKHKRRNHKTQIRAGLDVCVFCVSRRWPLSGQRVDAVGDVPPSRDLNSPCVSVSPRLRGQTSKTIGLPDRLLIPDDEIAVFLPVGIQDLRVPDRAHARSRAPRRAGCSRAEDRAKGCIVCGG
jgi:hypothetical protein